jgi:hypothetical protein
MALNENEWENDDLALELNHNYCWNQGRHPFTNDEDWDLFETVINEPYTEELYNMLKDRLKERKRNVSQWKAS